VLLLFFPDQLQNDCDGEEEDRTLILGSYTMSTCPSQGQVSPMASREGLTLKVFVTLLIIYSTLEPTLLYHLLKSIVYSTLLSTLL